MLNKQLLNVKDLYVDVAGEKLLISRRRKADFMQALTSYLGGY